MKESTIDWQKWRPLLIAILCTLSWITLFPLLYIGAMILGTILSAHMGPQVVNDLISYLALLIPLSSPVTIVCIWLSYFCKKNSLTYYSNFIPPLTILGVILIDGLLGSITEAYIRHNLIK